MRDWAADFGLVHVRRRGGTAADYWRRPGAYHLLTPEIAIPLTLLRDLPPWEQAAARAMAVGLTADTAVVAGKSAARLHGIGVLGSGDAFIELMYPDGRKPGARNASDRGVRYRGCLLPLADVTAIHGIRLTRVYRTLRDVSVYHGVAEGVVAMDSARRRWPAITADDLRGQVLGGRPFKGIGDVRRAIDLSIPDSGSVPESHARVLLALSGIPGLETIEPQAEIRDPVTGRPFRVDLLVNGWLAVEIDGAVKYDGRTYGAVDDVIRAEREREKALQNSGVVVVRVSDPRDVVERVRFALDGFRRPA